MKISTIITNVISKLKSALVKASIKVNAGYKALKDKLGLSENETFRTVESIISGVIAGLAFTSPLIVIANIIALFPNVAVSVLLVIIIHAYFRMAFKSMGSKLVKETV